MMFPKKERKKQRTGKATIQNWGSRIDFGFQRVCTGVVQPNVLEANLWRFRQRCMISKFRRRKEKRRKKEKKEELFNKDFGTGSFMLYDDVQTTESKCWIKYRGY